METWKYLRNTQSETGMLEEWKEGALVLLRYLPAEEPASTRPRDTGALQDIVECNLAAECHKSRRWPIPSPELIQNYHYLGSAAQATRVRRPTAGLGLAVPPMELECVWLHRKL